MSADFFAMLGFELRATSTLPCEPLCQPSTSAYLTTHSPAPATKEKVLEVDPSWRCRPTEGGSISPRRGNQVSCCRKSGQLLLHPPSQEDQARSPWLTKHLPQGSWRLISSVGSNKFTWGPRATSTTHILGLRQGRGSRVRADQDKGLIRTQVRIPYPGPVPRLRKWCSPESFQSEGSLCAFQKKPQCESQGGQGAGTSNSCWPAPSLPD
jgi:hypothetical protein